MQRTFRCTWTWTIWCTPAFSGLFDAASRYNPKNKWLFSGYAKHRIKGAILDSLRKLDWASRDMRRRHKQVEAATRELSVELQRAPDRRRGCRTARDGRGSLAHDDGRPAQRRPGLRFHSPVRQ